ncbi:maleylpyruvate isomerase family mycothiol-dependent enzyme [Propioniciclava sinopodophylli]|uniref:maleylpyruvate isomerase family mycothiol-dependent enzyme n=1 Tax=Propioniciclava sinopodophylli TaxID=1837344 RepID=UPI0024906B33|nr:maleylpyruvate isomerase family mycothiol-dependent enzyme [Propioniciclava sinopodophylli]
MLAILNQGQVEPALRRIATATQALLRHTLDLEEDDWRAPSLLPGWSRAHVASHISRNADALRRVIAAARDGEPAPLYPSSAAKFNDIERGSERSGLELHVDLDTSAGELANLCERVEDWLVPVRLIGGEFPLSVVTLIRLHELTLHHLDLDTGFTWEDVDLIPARWMLEWMLLLLRDDQSLPAVDIVSDAGVAASLGGVGERRTVTGPDAALWAWVTGRTKGEGLTDAEGISFPLAG